MGRTVPAGGIYCGVWWWPG